MLISLSLSFALSLSVSHSLSLFFLCVSVCASVCLSLSLFFSFSVCLSLSTLSSLSLSLSDYLPARNTHTNFPTLPFFSMTSFSNKTLLILLTYLLTYSRYIPLLLLLNLLLLILLLLTITLTTIHTFTLEHIQQQTCILCSALLDSTCLIGKKITISTG